MLYVEFKYKDAYTNGEWRLQSCECYSVTECIEMYGLGVDCDYEIISITEIVN